MSRRARRASAGGGQKYTGMYVRCPKCGRKHHQDLVLVGSRTVCPFCKERFVIAGRLLTREPMPTEAEWAELRKKAGVGEYKEKPQREVTAESCPQECGGVGHVLYVVGMAFVLLLKAIWSLFWKTAAGGQEAKVKRPRSLSATRSCHYDDDDKDDDDDFVEQVCFYMMQSEEDNENSCGDTPRRAMRYC